MPVSEWSRPVVPGDRLRAPHWNALVEYVLRPTALRDGVNNAYAGTASKRDYRRTAAASSNGPVVVKCVADGGSNGSLTTKCTRTFSIYPVSATTLDATTRLKATLTPRQARASLGYYRYDTETGGWSYGLAYNPTPDDNSGWILLTCFGEVAEAGACA